MLRNYYLACMHPILFTIPGMQVPVFSYGAILGLAFVIGWFVVMHFAEKEGLPKDKIANVFLITTFSSMIGARLMFIVTNPEMFADGGIAGILNVRKGGSVTYGGFLGGFIASLIYLRAVKIRFMAWADVAAPAMALGTSITRVGCLLYGCDYGLPISEEAPGWIKTLGVRFPNWQIKFPGLKERYADSLLGNSIDLSGSPAYIHHVKDGLVNRGAEYSAFVYPTQSLEIVNGLVALALLLLVRKQSKVSGAVFLAFTGYYGITRSLMEILRGDMGRGSIIGLSSSQLIGIVTTVLALTAYLVLRKQSKHLNP
ncbi:MAG: prolipoprotein diacylglyceryl transferase [Deltaproteobacteria bacterium]|nr:prolipoprotein diacylglyceryl transferase [Deltaproteobacteria bacterium]